MPAEILAEVWRGGHPEGAHMGHVAVADATGQLVWALGDPGRIVFPRSSCKSLQALPLVDSGAADRVGLSPADLALACASHDGGAMHTDRVGAWLDRIGLGEGDLRCGPQVPRDRGARDRIRSGEAHPTQLHNNCSGKHTGFLTLGRETGGGTEYIDPSHPVQKAVLEAFEEMTGETSPGHGIDGCSAPNFLCSLAGLARAGARMADPTGLGAARADAAIRLTRAMMAHPDLIAGEGRAPTALTAAAAGRAAVKDGAEGTYLAILPRAGLAIAVKVEDGAQRAADAAMAALLVRFGVLEAGDPAVTRFARATIRNRRDLAVGEIRAAEALTRR